VCATGADGQDPCQRLGCRSEGIWGLEENSGACVTNVLEHCWANDRRLVWYQALLEGPSSFIAETWREQLTYKLGKGASTSLRACCRAHVPSTDVRQRWGTTANGGVLVRQCGVRGSIPGAVAELGADGPQHSQAIRECVEVARAEVTDGLEARDLGDA
jgi:hypothetical protein